MAELFNLGEALEKHEASKEAMVNDRVDSPSFFHGREFVPAALADYIIERHNIFHGGDSFYIYDQRKGVWVEEHDNVIGKLMKDALGAKAKTSRIRDALKLLEMDTFLDPKKTKDIPMIINLSNGMLNIKTRKLLPHDKSYYSTVQIPIEYDRNAKCPKFDRYLDEIFADDLEKIDAIQEFAGYCLYPDIFIHKCLFLVGGGANGKSIFINTLSKIVGEQNISALELHQLSDKFLIGTLKNKLLNASSEVQTKKQVNASIFKQVVAGDLIQADKKHKQPFTFRPIAKHIFSMNEIPVLTDRTYAFERRLIVITFNQTFSGADEDKRLEEKLESELSGILNWCLEGLSAVLKNNEIMESDQMKDDKRDFLRSINPVKVFVEEACVLAEPFKIQKRNLYDAYKLYCKDSGMKALSKIKFYKQLQADYLEIAEVRPDGGERFFRGINVLEGYDPVNRIGYY